jgi:hypothetical protein
VARKNPPVFLTGMVRLNTHRKKFASLPMKFSLLRPAIRGSENKSRVIEAKFIFLFKLLQEKN